MFFSHRKKKYSQYTRSMKAIVNWAYLQDEVTVSHSSSVKVPHALDINTPYSFLEMELVCF